MGGNDRSIDLVIRARNEADRAIESVTGALNRLLGSQDATSKSAVSLAADMAALVKASATVGDAATRGEEAFKRQQAALVAAKGQYVAVKVEADYAAKALENLRAKASMVGPQQGGPEKLAADIKAASAALKTLERDAGRIQSTITKLGGTFTASGAFGPDSAKSVSALQQLGSMANVVAEAEAKVTAQLETQSQVRAEIARRAEQQAAAASKASGMQSMLGPRPAATSAGATYEALNGAAEAEGLRAAAAAHAMFEQRVRSGVAAMKAAEAEDSRAAAAAYTMFEQRARSGAAAMKAAEAAQQADAAAARHLRAELDPLAAAQERVNQRQREANELFARGAITEAELTARTKQLTAQRVRNEADHKSAAKFGLKPYEMQNLGYQVNDVVSGLASGQGAGQIIAQQGGQILQLFPKVSAAIGAAFLNPAFLGAAAVFGGIAFAVHEVSVRAEELRAFEGLLTRLGNGADYTAAALQKDAEALRHYGVAAEDAHAALTAFVSEGVAPERLVEFGKTALDMSETLGIKVPDAAKMLSEGLTGSYEAVLKLNDATGFLTAAEAEHIRKLFEEGKAAEARSESYDIFAAKQAKAAADARGPWSDAVKSLHGAWESFDQWVAGTSMFNDLAAGLDHIAKRANILIDALAGVRKAVDIDADITKLLNLRASLESGAVAPTGGETRDAAIAKIKQQVAALEAEKAAQTGRHTDLFGTPEQRAAAAKPGADPLGDRENTAAGIRESAAMRLVRLETELQTLRDKGDKGLTAAEKARRTALAGQLAYEQEAGGERLAALKRAQAIEKETAAIRKQAETFARQAEADREKAIRQFSQRVSAAEGGAGKNPNGSAQGYGQFINSTWLDQFAKVYPDVARTMGGGTAPRKATDPGATQVLALRQNEQVARGIIDNYARENAKFLEGMRQQVTAGNLYLTHFLGQAGARKVFANPDAPVDKIGLSADALSGNQGYLRLKGKNSRYVTGRELQARLADKMGDTGAAQSSGAATLENMAEEREKKQRDLNLALKQENDARLRNITALTEENTLQDTALIAAQRKAALADAEADVRKKVEDANKSLKEWETPFVVDPADVQRARDLAGALFDAAHAKQQAQGQTSEVMRPVGDLTGERDALRARQEALRSLGDFAGADALGGQLDAVNAKLRDAIDLAIQFYEKLKPEDDPLHRTQEQIDAVVLGLRSARDESQEWGRVLGQSGKQVRDVIANSMTSSIDKFAQAVGQGKNVFKSLKDAFLDFAASFLRQIALMIIQQYALLAVTAILKAFGVSMPGGGGGSTLNKVTSAGSHHSGGVIGSPNATRAVSPAWFTNATRMHTGGIVGLQPDEVPIIAKRNEEVLTEGDPRHRKNGGMSPQSGGGNTTVILATDPAASLEHAMRTPAGERVIMEHVRENAGTYKQIINGR